MPSITKSRSHFGFWLSAFALTIALLAPTAPAQCVAGWSEAFGSPYMSGAGFYGPIAAFDDGSGPKLFAAKEPTGTTGSLARWNGVAWSAVPFLPASPTPSSLAAPRAFAVYDDGSGPALYVGFDGSITLTNGLVLAGIGRWNGTAWSQVGAGFSGSVFALAVFDDGTGPALHAAGSIYASGAVTINHVARWNGSSWSDVGGGVFGDVTSLTSWNDGSGPGLYATGIFTFAGSAPASRVARWNGTAWSALGSGLGGTGFITVLDAAVFDDGSGPALFVTGTFTTAGGLGASNLAKWNGATWSGYGLELNQAAAALEVWDDGTGAGLFVLGHYSLTPVGTPANGLARYRNGAWSSVGSGFPSVKAAGAVGYDDGSGPALYAVGAGNNSTLPSAVVRWNGAAWMPLPGLGLLPGGRARSFEVADVGSGAALFAAGDFSAQLGAMSGGLGVLAGTQWSPVGSGLQAVSIGALASFDDGTGPALFAGGPNASVGGAPDGKIARWDGSSWSNLLGGVSGGANPPFVQTRVNALAVYDAGLGPRLVVGGHFTTAGGVSANGLATWNGSSWSAFGGVPGVEMTCLLVADLGTGPSLFAAGRTAGSFTTGIVARCIGSSWQIIGNTTGTSAQGPKALTVFDDGGGPALYVGGHFGSIDGVTSTGVMKWTVSSWVSVGPPVPASSANIRALAVYDDGSGPALYAGGSLTQSIFTPPPVLPPFGLLRMTSPGNWSPVGGDVHGVLGTGVTVETLRVLDDGSGPSLYVGGDFGLAGGVPSSGIAKWGPLRPSLGVSQAGPGAPVVVRNSWLVKDHEYYNVFSDQPCSPLGTGPYLGLCASDLSLLLLELSLPLGAVPVHFQTSFVNQTFPGIQLPPGLALDGVSFDWTGGSLGCFSKVTGVVVQ